VIDDESLLVLPLVHHLVQQRVYRLVPSVAPDVAPAQYDLRLATPAGRTVVPKPALHTARDANWNLAKSSAESLPVVCGVQSRQLANERNVRRIRLFWGSSSSWSISRSRDRELENRSPGLLPNHTISPMHERYDRSPDFFIGAEEAVVDP